MTAEYACGLVVGKFYPPHRGHLHLISEAARLSERVTVLAMAARPQTVPLADRVAWLRAACAGQPGVTVTGAPMTRPGSRPSRSPWTCACSPCGPACWLCC